MLENKYIIREAEINYLIIYLKNAEKEYQNIKIR